MLASRKDFRTLITNVWHDSPSLTEALVSIVTRSREKNTISFGNIFKTKIHLLVRISGAQCALAANPSNSLAKLEKAFRMDFNNVLYQEILWYQKSLVK